MQWNSHWAAAKKKLKKIASKCLTVVDDVLWFPPPSNRPHNKQRCEPTNTYRDCHKNGRSSWDARKPIFKSQRFPRTPSKEGAHGDHEYSLLLRCQRLSSYNDYSLSGYSPRVFQGDSSLQVDLTRDLVFQKIFSRKFLKTRRDI